MRLSLLGLLAGGAGATGAETCPLEKGWVAVDVSEAGLDAATGSRLLRHLRASVEQLGLVVCSTPQARSPAARVSVLAAGQDTLEVRVVVDDERGLRTAARRVQTGTVPPDSLALLVALAAEELLRGATDATPPPLVEQPQPPVAVDAAPPRAQFSRLNLELAALAAFELYGGGQRHLGGELGVRWRPAPRLGFELRGGLRTGFPVATVNGVVDASAWSLGAAGRVELLPYERVGLEGVLFVDAISIRFSGRPSGDTVGATSDGWAAAIGGGATSWFSITSRVRLEIDFSGAWVPRGVKALDTGATVTGATLAALRVRLGLALQLGGNTR